MKEMDENEYGIPIPFKKIPEKTVYGTYGICCKCFSRWTEESGCSNKECPKIIYREIEKNG